MEGEAGIGKSRLVDELVARLAERGASVQFLLGAHPPGGAPARTDAFLALVRDHIGTEGVEEAIAPSLRETPYLVPGFAALLRGEMAPPGAVTLGEEARQTALAAVLSGLAAERPTIVAVEDLQLASAEERRTFLAVAGAVRGHRLLLVGTTRPGLPATWHAALEGAVETTRIRLARLGAKDLARLLEDGVGSRVAAELGWKIAQKSDGNPYFALEILKSLKDANRILQGADGAWRITGTLRDVEIPSSVVDLVAARLDALDDDEREILEVAACCGHEFDAALVATALGRERIPLLRALGRIERGPGLVRSTGARFRFDHHQVQETLYARLSPPLRSEYHVLLAKAIEASSSPADEDPGRAVELCHHFLHGGRHADASPYLAPALAWLYQTAQYEAVVDLAERALAGPAERRRRLEILLSLGSALQPLGRWARWEEILAEMVRLADEEGDLALRAQSRSALGWFYCEVGRHGEGQAAFEEQLQLAIRLGDRALEAVALGNARGYGIDTGHFEEAKDAYLRQVAIAREIGNRKIEQQGLGNLGLSLEYLGRWAGALDAFRGSLALSEVSGDRVNSGLCHVALGRMLPLLGEPERGHAHLEVALSTFRALGPRRAETYALHRLGIVAEQAGDLARAEALYEAGLSMRRELGYRGGVARSLRTLGALQVARGRTEEGAARLEEAEAVARAVEDHGDWVLAAAYLALLGRRDASAAESLFAELEPRLRAADRLEALYVLWRTTGGDGHLAAARRLLDDLVLYAPPDHRKGMVERVPLHRAVREGRGRGPVPTP